MKNRHAQYGCTSIQSRAYFEILQIIGNFEIEADVPWKGKPQRATITIC